MEINPAITFKHDRTVMYAKRPKVLIVGAGLGGLTLGMLLQKTDIPFEIYERAPAVKPFGAAMYFNCTTANLFKQCGIYEEFQAIGEYVSSIQFCNEDREVDFSHNFAGHEKEFGAKGYIVARPQLYDLLLRQIPKERLHLGKKVLTTEQGGNGVLIRFSDGSEADGDILVGADGAYSAVRQNLYAKLKKDRNLPTSDDLPLPFSTVCLVGQTVVLTPEEFPDIALDKSQFRQTVGKDKMYSWSTFTTTQNTVCWGSVLFLDKETSKTNDSFRNSEWGPEAAAEMCEEVKDFPIISGGDKIRTLKDLMDRTPKELISKVMLEEKIFKTWYSCRTVLMGDACHKFSPSGGVGGANALHDAVALVNRINSLPFHPISEEIEAAFKEYKDERISWVKTAFESSKGIRNMAGQISRTVFKNIPGPLMRRLECLQFCHRPQVAFLPLADDKGYFKPAAQPSLLTKAPQESKKTEPVVANTVPTAAIAL